MSVILVSKATFTAKSSFFVSIIYCPCSPGFMIVLTWGFGVTAEILCIVDIGDAPSVNFKLPKVLCKVKLIERTGSHTAYSVVLL